MSSPVPLSGGVIAPLTGASGGGGSFSGTAISASGSIALIDLITEASVMAGITALGQTLDGNSANYGFQKINQMVDLWATERLAMFRSERTSEFDLTAGTGSYTIGAGETWNHARPLWIDGAGIIQNPSATYPVELPLHVYTRNEWRDVFVKTVQSGLPRSLWYDRSYSAGTIYLHPVPNSSIPTIVLYVPVAVSEFASLNETVSLPPGYRMALISNLAVLLCLGLRPIPEGVGELAVYSFGKLKSVNVVTHMDALECDEAILPYRSGRWNFYQGDIR